MKNWLKSVSYTHLLVLACVLLVLVMQSCSASLVTLGNSTIGAVGASTYPCEDGDLLGAEDAYCGLETEPSTWSSVHCPSWSEHKRDNST